MLAVLQPVVVFLLVLVCVAGLWALAAPRSFLRLNRLSGAWVETGGVENRLSQRQFALDRLIYRHHFLSGFLLVATSLSLLYLALFRFAGTAAVSSPASAGVWSGLLYEAMLSVACLAGIIGMIVGMIVFIRPSSLKLAESWGNRSVSLQPLIAGLERRFGMIDRWVERHTRLFGGLVLLSSMLIGLPLWEVMR
jgi:hypothetical protein